MSRAQFDRDEIIDKAIELFWKNGFNSSSMQQVVKATGLKPGSIYLAFGSKKGLYQEALEIYAQKAITFISSVLDNAPSVGEGILQILEKNIRESTGGNYSSCFLVKTQLELSAEGGELHALASAKLKEIEALYQSYLEKEFDRELSSKRAASLMLNIFGMRVYGYHHGAAEQMRQGLRESLPWLPWKKS